LSLISNFNWILPISGKNLVPEPANEAEEADEGGAGPE
jgi:hypothetical protein